MNAALLRIACIALGSLVLSCDSDDGGAKAAPPIASCEGTYTACGGDVKGTWNFGNLCVTGSVPVALNALLVDYPSCSNAFTEGTLDSTISVTYTATNFTRSGTNHLTGKMKINAACFGEMTMGAALSATSCGAFAQVLPNNMTGRCRANNMECVVKVSCGYDGTTCNCDTDTTETVSGTGTYTTSGSTLTESTGATYQYCVNGNQLSESGVVSDGVAGVIYLNK